MIGDVSALAAAAPAALLNARYSRDLEREADAYAVRALRAVGIAPTRLADMLERMETEHSRAGRESPAGAFSYLSDASDDGGKAGRCGVESVRRVYDYVKSSRPFFAAPSPAIRPVAQAHAKLCPPMGPNASRISPQRNKPRTRRLSSVFGSTSSSATPPPVTSAFLKPSWSVQGNWAGDQALDELHAILASQFRRPKARRYPTFRDQGVCQTLRHMRRNDVRDEAGRADEMPVPCRFIELGPADAQHRPRFSGREASNSHVRYVEHGRSAVAAMREEKAAVGFRSKTVATRRPPFAPARLTFTDTPGSLA